jgi:hypothetical protein
LFHHYLLIYAFFIPVPEAVWQSAVPEGWSSSGTGQPCSTNGAAQWSLQADCRVRCPQVQYKTMLLNLFAGSLFRFFHYFIHVL